VRSVRGGDERGKCMLVEEVRGFKARVVCFWQWRRVVSEGFRGLEVEGAYTHEDYR